MEFQFVLTKEEIRYLTKGFVLFDPVIFQAIQGMERGDKECAVSLPADKLYAFLGQITSALNMSENSRARRVLRALFDRLNKLLYDGDKEFIKGKVNARMIYEFENSEFIHDFSAFLDYVAHNKIELSAAYEYIPRKHWKKINELFVNPASLIYFDGKERKTEEEMPRFYFMDLLALNSDLIKISKNKKLSVTRFYKGYLAQDNFSRMVVILINWMFYIDWEVFCPYPACKPYTRLNEHWDIIADIFMRLMHRFEEDIPIDEVAVQILDETGFLKKYGIDSTETFNLSEVQGLIFDPLHYFGLIKYITEDRHGIPIPKYFNVNPLLFNALFTALENFKRGLD